MGTWCHFLRVLDAWRSILVPILTDKSIHLAAFGGEMGDLLYVGLTILFLVLTRGFIEVCSRLMESKL